MAAFAEGVVAGLAVATSIHVMYEVNKAVLKTLFHCNAEIGKAVLRFVFRFPTKLERDECDWQLGFETDYRPPETETETETETLSIPHNV